MKIMKEMIGTWRTCNLRNCVRCHFMSCWVQILYLTIISPFVWHVKCGSDRTSVRVDTPFFEQVRVKDLIQIVYGVIKCQQNHLGYTFHGHISYCVWWGADSVFMMWWKECAIIDSARTKEFEENNVRMDKTNTKLLLVPDTNINTAKT